MFSCVWCSLNLNGVNAGIILSVAIGKLLVFMVAAAFVCITSRSSQRSAKIGIYGNFATNSNDLAFGIPIVAAVFPPAFGDVLFLIAGLQALLINPISFVFLESAKAAKEQPTEALTEAPDAEMPRGPSSLDTVKKLIKSLGTNPYVMGTLIGLILGLLLNTNTPKDGLPPFFNDLCTSIGNAFGFCALFSLGMGIYGKTGALRGRGVLQPGLLVLLKTVLLPIIIYLLAGIFVPIFTDDEAEIANYRQFAYVYGSIPTSASVAIWSRQYSVYPDRISAAMVLCMLAAAPLLFTATILLQNADSDLTPIVAWTESFMGLLGLVCALLVVALIIFSPKFRRMRGAFPLDVLVAYYACLALGLAGARWCGEALQAGAESGFPYHVSQYFRLCASAWLVCLAVVLLIASRDREAAGAHLYKMRVRMHLIAWLLPLVVTALIALLATPVDHMMTSSVACVDRYAATQTVPLLVVACLVLIAVISTIVRIEKYTTKDDPLPADLILMLAKGAEASGVKSGDDTMPGASVQMNPVGSPESKGEDIDASAEHERDASSTSESQQIYLLGGELDDSAPPEIRTSDGQMFRLLLLFSMVGTILEVAILAAVLSGSLLQTGIIVQVHFVQIVMCNLQPLFGLLLLASQHPYISEMISDALKSARKTYRRVFLNAGSRPYIAGGYVDESGEGNIQRLRELAEMIAAPDRQLVRDRRWRLRRHKDVAVGRELVTWLVRSGKAADRVAALELGRALEAHGLLAHVTNEHEFEDDFLFYRVTAAVRQRVSESKPAPSPRRR